MQQLLLRPPALINVLESRDLWLNGSPITCFGCFRAEMPLELRSTRLVLKGSPFWSSIDGQSSSAPFAPCTRKELVIPQDDKSEPVVMIRWIYRTNPSSTPSASGWTREICILKSELLLSSTSNDRLCTIGIIQRETLRNTKRANPSSLIFHQEHVIDDSESHSRKRRALLPKQLSCFDTWSLSFCLNSTSTPAPADWQASWGSQQQLDLWRLDQVARTQAIALVTAAFASVAIYWDEWELRELLTPSGIEFTLDLDRLRVPNFCNVEQAAFVKNLAMELSTRFEARPTRVLLPQGFLNNMTTKEAASLVDWRGGLYTGPLMDGQPHGWGKWSRGDMKTMFVDHEGQFAYGVPNGPGICRVTHLGEAIVTVAGDWMGGGFGKRGRIAWADGSSYDGDMLNKDWIFVNSRLTGRLYRVSVLASLSKPTFELLRPDYPKRSMSYSVASSRVASESATTRVGVQSLLQAIEETEAAELPIAPPPSPAVDMPFVGESLPEELPIDPLPLEERIYSLLSDSPL